MEMSACPEDELKRKALEKTLDALTRRFKALGRFLGATKAGKKRKPGLPDKPDRNVTTPEDAQWQYEDVYENQMDSRTPEIGDISKSAQDEMQRYKEEYIWRDRE